MAQQSIFKSLSTIASFKYVCKSRLPFVQQPFAGIKKDTKDMLSKLNIPEKPKKPTTPFLKYVNDQRNVIMREHPDYRVSDVAKRCSETWKTISSNQKSMYEQQYKKELQEYAKIQVEYESKLSQDQKTALEIAEREKQEQRKRRKLKKMHKETNKPKRPLTSYMLFCMEESKKLNAPPIKIASQLKEMWTNLPDSEKKKYQMLAEEGKRRYFKEMEAWEQKMQQEGKEHLMRRQSLKASKIPVRLASQKTKKYSRSASNRAASQSVSVNGASEFREDSKNEVANDRDKPEEKEVIKSGLFGKVKKIFG